MDQYPAFRDYRESLRIIDSDSIASSIKAFADIDTSSLFKDYRESLRIIDSDSIASSIKAFAGIDTSSLFKDYRESTSTSNGLYADQTENTVLDANTIRAALVLAMLYLVVLISSDETGRAWLVEWLPIAAFLYYLASYVIDAVRASEADDSDE